MGTGKFSLKRQTAQPFQTRHAILAEPLESPPSAGLNALLINVYFRP